GRSTYQQNCASCHLADLGGRNEAPPLAGANFMAAWRTRTTKDLFDYMHTMPPSGPSLTDDQYLGIVAFVLQSNGAAPGPGALTSTTALAIGSVTTGPAPQAALAQAGGGGAAGQAADAGRGRGAQPPAGAGRGGPGTGGGRGGQSSGPIGLTVTGEVKNYVPVSDEMLRNQDQGDWLMARRNYQGWSFSPLNQITTGNVQNLKLAWVWAMNENAGA